MSFAKSVLGAGWFTIVHIIELSLSLFILWLPVNQSRASSKNAKKAWVDGGLLGDLSREEQDIGYEVIIASDSRLRGALGEPLAQVRQRARLPSP